LVEEQFMKRVVRRVARLLGGGVVAGIVLTIYVVVLTRGKVFK
jgi:hypothetical protein